MQTLRSILRRGLSANFKMKFADNPRRKIDRKSPTPPRLALLPSFWAELITSGRQKVVNMPCL